MSNNDSAPQIILASSSIYRQQLLQQIGLEFQAISPDVDETLVQQNQSLTPIQIAEQLAKLKADSVATNHPNCIVIGSDQVVDFNGTTIGKPGSRNENIELLKQLSGHTHHLFTAVCVCFNQQCIAFTNKTALTVRSLTETEITRYVDRDQAFDCAGGYRWEAAGIALFDQIETEDHSAILGLPLIKLVTVLRSLDIAIPC